MSHVITDCIQYVLHMYWYMKRRTPVLNLQQILWNIFFLNNVFHALCILSFAATVFLAIRSYRNKPDLFNRSDRVGLVLWWWPFATLSPHSPVRHCQACVVFDQRVGGGGMGEEEVGSCFWHVCISKTRGEGDKRITVDVFSLLNDTHVMLPHIVAFTDQSVFRKVIVFYLRVSVFLLFCSLSSTQSSFLYYFIAVSESHPPPPPLFLSLFFYPFPPSSSLPPSHFLSLHVPLSIVVICPVANSASVRFSRLC